MEKNSLKLMIPGPVQPDPAVLAAMGAPVVAHYGPAFTAFYNETIELLRGVFQTQGSVFLMNGSGTVAIDACIGSAFCSGDTVLVGVNGFFGERLQWIAEGYGLQVIPIQAEWGYPLKAEDFEAAYAAHPEAKGAIAVHLETSTAVVNPIEQIGPIVRQHGGIFFVDAVSSLGGLTVAMDDWDIDLCASASQKCLGAPPGLAPVAVGQRGWEFIDRAPQKAHGWYGDLRVWKWYVDNWADWHPFPVTMATNNIAALRVALDQLLAEGIANRLERYRRLALRLRDGLRNVGMPPFTPDWMLAPVLTAAYGPKGVPTGKIVTYLANEHHIQISGGLGSLKNEVFRIGHMSPVLSEADIDEVVSALAAFKS